MDPEIPDSAEPDHQSARLQASLARLDVHRHERLAYTEPPVMDRHPKLPGSRGRLEAFWKAVCHWVISR